MSRRPDGPPPEPAVQRLRLRYAKRGRLRFSSHRDFQRALERALRRAGVPMAYSAGFNPHPKISYANAAPTGAASEAEFVEIAVTQVCDPVKIRAVLDEGLPDGLDIVDAVVAGPGALADRLEASEWEVVLPGVDVAEADAAATALMATGSVEVSRTTKNGVRTFDVRPSLLAVTARQPQVAGAACAILRVVIRHGNSINGLPSVRPDDVITGLRHCAAGFAPSVTPAVTRLAQGPLDADTVAVGDPLAADRDAALG